MNKWIGHAHNECMQSILTKKSLVRRREATTEPAAELRDIALLNEARSDEERKAIARAAVRRFRSRRRRP